MKYLLIACALAVATIANAQQPVAATAPESPDAILYNSFSHNDYWRDRPLWDALSYGFNCVEADLWIIDNELYVSHDRPEPHPDITFKRLYLEPLAQRIHENNGQVYPASDRPFYLMVDFKTKGEKTYRLLKKQLEPYKELFCAVEQGEYRAGPILLFISGERPQKTMKKEKQRYAFLDGRLSDLGKEIPSLLSPVISDDYSDYLTWRGEGEMPEEELIKMRQLIDAVHQEGKLFRWWGAPDTEQFKRLFLREGVDFIGADNLEPLYLILREE